MSQKHKKMVLCVVAALFVVTLGLVYTFWWTRMEQPVMVQANSPDLRTLIPIERPEPTISIVSADVAIIDGTAIDGAAPQPEPREIKVHIAGAVENAGLVSLPEGSRVADGIAAAGGPSEDADLERINLASFLHDAERFYVPRISAAPIETEPVIETRTQPEPQNNLIDINKATENELQALPGIGPVISRNIVRFREENGNFRSIEEIMMVPRIGEGLFNQIRGLITI